MNKLFIYLLSVIIAVVFCAPIPTNNTLKYKRIDFIGNWNWYMSDSTNSEEYLFSDTTAQHIQSGLTWYSATRFSSWTFSEDTVFFIRNNTPAISDSIIHFKFRFYGSDTLTLFYDSTNIWSIYDSIGIWKKYIKKQ